MAHKQYINIYILQNGLETSNLQKEGNAKKFINTFNCLFSFQCLEEKYVVI